jgi:hypothetical protein
MAFDRGPAFDRPSASQYIRPPSSACPGGGIGRRAGFRCQWGRLRGGSSPLLGTIYRATARRSLRAGVQCVSRPTRGTHPWLARTGARSQPTGLAQSRRCSITGKINGVDQNVGRTPENRHGDWVRVLSLIKDCCTSQPTPEIAGSLEWDRAAGPVRDLRSTRARVRRSRRRADRSPGRNFLRQC